MGYIDTDCGRVDVDNKFTFKIEVNSDLNIVEAQLDRIIEKLNRVNNALNDVQAVFAGNESMLPPPMVRLPDDN